MSMVDTGSESSLARKCHFDRGLWLRRASEGRFNDISRTKEELLTFTVMDVDDYYRLDRMLLGGYPIDDNLFISENPYIA